MSKEQAYYKFLARTDHPVFRKDYTETTDKNSPANSIMNRVLADQMIKLRETTDLLRLNAYPHTVTELTINEWETQYFGFTKPSLPLQQRIDELLIKFNKRFSMSLIDVKEIAKAIVGQSPIVVRNLQRQGFTLGQSVLGYSTTFAVLDNSLDGVYLVSFLEPVDPELLEKLDERLTIIEKAGSRHILVSAIPRWVLNQSSVGITTTLG